MDFRRETVSELADQVRSGQLAARELVGHALDRIEALNGAYNAFVAVDADAAMKAAKTKELAQATAQANVLERKEGSDVVLVAVSDLKSLRRAYPNYFADTTEFLARVSQVTKLPIPHGPWQPLPEPELF